MTERTDRELTENQREWTLYSDKKPIVAGVYEWRLPSQSVPGLTLIVAAHMRWRGAGADNVLSPVFDHWDGYRVRVPEFVEWRATPDHQNIKTHQEILVSVEGLEPSRCIYCGHTPRIEGHCTAPRGGIVVNAAPWDWNSWRFSCCDWGTSPRLSDPRNIETIRKAAIVRAAAAMAEGGEHG